MLELILKHIFALLIAIAIFICISYLPKEWQEIIRHAATGWLVGDVALRIVRIK